MLEELLRNLASHRPSRWPYRSALTVVSAAVFVTATLVPSVFAAGNMGKNQKSISDHLRVGSQTLVETKSTQKKSHKLIRRSNLGTSASSALPGPSTDMSPPSGPITTDQVFAPSTESPSSLSKDTGVTKASSQLAVSVPTPMPLKLTGQSTKTPPASPSAALIGTISPSSSPSSNTAAATSGGGTNNMPASMRRLVSEIPGTAQIMAAEESTTPPVATSPTINRTPSAFLFSSIQNGTTPSFQTLSISNNGSGTLSWTASSNSAWLTLNNATSASGTNTGSVTVRVNPSGLSVGTHSGIITILTNGATNSPQTVTVTYDITPAPTPTIGLSTTSLTFAGAQGNSLAAQSVVISNSGSGTLNWSASTAASWLSLSPASGTGSGTVTVTPNIMGLTAGTYSSTISVSAFGATNTPQSVTVTLTVTAALATSLTVSPGSLTYTATQGAANPANQSLSVSSNTSWTVSDNASWLTVNPPSATNNGSLNVSVNTSSATVGTNTATITLTGGGITRTVAVTLTLNSPATSSATLTWNANSENDLASYRIYRSTTPGAYGSAIATVPAGTTTYAATGLTVGTTYYFRITAVDSSNNESQPSTEVSKSIF